MISRFRDLKIIIIYFWPKIHNIRCYKVVEYPNIYIYIYIYIYRKCEHNKYSLVGVLRGRGLPFVMLLHGQRVIIEQLCEGCSKMKRTVVLMRVSLEIAVELFLKIEYFPAF